MLSYLQKFLNFFQTKFVLVSETTRQPVFCKDNLACFLLGYLHFCGNLQYKDTACY